MARRSAALLLPLLLALAGPAAAGRGYRNPAYRIRAFEVPRGFRITTPPPYPGVLVLALAEPTAKGIEGSRITLAAQRLVPGTTAIELAATARSRLIEQGFAEPRVLLEGDRARLETAWQGRLGLRQIYIVDGDLAVVVTLAAPILKLPQALHLLDAAVAKLELEEAPPPSEEAPSPARPQGSR